MLRTDSIRGVSERLRRAAERWPKVNPQELAHLERELSRIDSAAQFAVLAEPFSKALPSEIGGTIQEYAGRLLLRLKPPSPYEAQHTVRLLLSEWDVSVEQMPWYLEAVFGQQG